MIYFMRQNGPPKKLGLNSHFQTSWASRPMGCLFIKRIFFSVQWTRVYYYYSSHVFIFPRLVQNFRGYSQYFLGVFFPYMVTFLWFFPPFCKLPDPLLAVLPSFYVPSRWQSRLLAPESDQRRYGFRLVK